MLPFLKKTSTTLNQTYHDYPRLFWIVVGTGFIDGVGGTMLFPFFALYITQKFSVGMTVAGLLLGIFSLFGILGGIVGGALTDRFGRKRLILFGLIFSALTTLSLGLVTDIRAIYPLAALIGLIGSLSGPAHNAMIADILPEEKRQEGFGILRVVANLAWIIGPSIGGFLAKINFFYIFVIDSILSCLVAIIIARILPETMPQHTPKEGHAQESLWITVKGYGIVLKDLMYVAFIVASMLMLLVYQQLYGSLSVFLRDEHGVDPQGYGFLMASSAITVVLFQIWVSRKLRGKPAFAMMAFGTVFYIIGFTMFGLVQWYSLFVAAVVVITLGEMIVMPVSQGLAANFAPEAMRGRYMAVFSLSWAVPSTIGPGAAGYLLDHYDPNLLWYLGGGLCAISALCFLVMHMRIGKQERFIPKSVPSE